jgi:membrane protease YdiL (CAAX protease family)
MGHSIESADIALILLFSFSFAILILWAAAKWGFFRLPAEPPPPVNIKGKTVLIFFALYVASFLICVPLFLKIFAYIFYNSSYHTEQREVLTLSFTQFFSVLFGVGLIVGYSWMQSRALIASIWKNPLGTQKPWYVDFGMGVLGWLISFPLVILVGTIGDILIAYFFDVYSYEQAAVRFIKKVSPYPGCLYLILASVIIAAPLIEEFLFRGCLQNWLKKRFGFKTALTVASVLFASFHITASQGAGNIPLFASLCVLGLFLGFLYERQGSLFAPIGLHMTFNALSAFRLVYSL